MKKIRVGDEVIVISGKDKGKVGKVTRVIVGDARHGDQLIVSNVNVCKKHVKPNPAKNELGGIVDKLMPIHVSNVAIYNMQTKKADRVGFKLENNLKIRILKSTKAELGVNNG